MVHASELAGRPSFFMLHGVIYVNTLTVLAELRTCTLTGLQLCFPFSRRSFYSRLRLPEKSITNISNKQGDPSRHRRVCPRSSLADRRPLRRGTDSGPTTAAVVGRRRNMWLAVATTSWPLAPRRHQLRPRHGNAARAAVAGSCSGPSCRSKRG